MHHNPPTRASYRMSLFSMLSTPLHFCDVIMWVMASQITSLTIQPFIPAQIKENIKAPRHWPLCGKFTGHRRVLDTTGRSLCELQLQHWNKYMEESCRFQRAMLTMKTTKIHTLQCYWRLNVTDTQDRWHMNSIWWKCNAINCLKNWYWFPRSFWFLFHFFQRTNSFYVRLTDGVSSPF